MASLGWMAVGFGSGMSSAEMFVTWPNSDGSWSVSHRQASGHSQPQEPSTPLAASDLQIISSLSSAASSPSSQITFLRPLTLSNAASKVPALSRAAKQNFVYAYSSQNPGSKTSTASITQHDDNAFGVSTIDLSVAVAVSNSGGNTAAGGGSVTVPTAASNPQEDNVAGPWTTYDSIIVLQLVTSSFRFDLLI